MEGTKNVVAMSPNGKLLNERKSWRGQRNVGLSAREWFALLRSRLLESRPVTLVPHKHKTVQKLSKTGKPIGKPKPLMVEVFGRPTFRNVIEDGELR